MIDLKTWIKTLETDVFPLLRDCAVSGFADYSKNAKKLGR